MEVRKMPVVVDGKAKTKVAVQHHRSSAAARRLNKGKGKAKPRNDANAPVKQSTPSSASRSSFRHMAQSIMLAARNLQSGRAAESSSMDESEL